VYREDPIVGSVAGQFPRLGFRILRNAA